MGVETKNRGVERRRGFIFWETDVVHEKKAGETLLETPGPKPCRQCRASLVKRAA